MPYRTNLGCLWLALLILILGGMPLLVGVLRVFGGLILLVFVLGLAATWWIRRNAVLHYTQTRGERHREFVEKLVVLLVRLAEIDGELDRREVSAIRHFFQNDLGYRDEQLLWIRDLIKDSRRSTEDVEAICAAIRADFMLQERVIVLQVLARVANADGRVTEAERAFVETVARHLGLEAFVGGFGSAGFGGGMPGSAPATSQVDEALAVLGVQRDADADAIKSAWRALSKENHPDLVAHLGDEFRSLAEERMRKINSAYETLKDAGLAS
jgi:DnaJ like chaperone protein